MEKERIYYTVDEIKALPMFNTGSRNEDIVALANAVDVCMNYAKFTVYKEVRMDELNQARRILEALKDKARS